MIPSRQPTFASVVVSNKHKVLISAPLVNKRILPYFDVSLLITFHIYKILALNFFDYNLPEPGKSGMSLSLGVT
jgi:hypothetical protein